MGWRKERGRDREEERRAYDSLNRRVTESFPFCQAEHYYFQLVSFSGHKSFLRKTHLQKKKETYM